MKNGTLEDSIGAIGDVWRCYFHVTWTERSTSTIGSEMPCSSSHFVLIATSPLGFPSLRIAVPFSTRSWIIPRALEELHGGFQASAHSSVRKNLENSLLKLSRSPATSSFKTSVQYSASYC